MYQISGLSLKNCDWELPDIHTYRRTDGHTEDRNRGIPVETEIPRRARYWLSHNYWVVKQGWLVNITRLYSVQVSVKYLVAPSAFSITSKSSNCYMRYRHISMPILNNLSQNGSFFFSLNSEPEIKLQNFYFLFFKFYLKIKI